MRNRRSFLSRIARAAAIAVACPVILRAHITPTADMDALFLHRIEIEALRSEPVYLYDFIMAWHAEPRREP